MRNALAEHPNRAELLDLYNSKRVTDKDFVKLKYDSFRNDSCRSKSMSTSGTTGNGLSFPVTTEFFNAQWAVFRKQYAIFGLCRSWRYQFSGYRWFSSNSEAIDFFGKRVFLSQYAIGEEAASKILESFANRGIDWVHGYPSAIIQLVRFFRAQRSVEELRSLGIRFVSTSSENISDEQIKLLEETFDCRVFQLYGQSEGVANFFTCEAGAIHVNEGFSIVDFLPSEHGFRIVGTSLHNKAFPFIRYDTGDVVDFVSTGCRCGRSSRVVKGIQGRAEVGLFNSQGHLVGRLDHLTKGINDLNGAQFYQSALVALNAESFVRLLNLILSKK